MKRKKIDVGEKIAVNFTTKERLIIEDKTFLGNDYFISAIDTAKGISVLLNLEDIEDILGHIAATSNNTDDSKLQDNLDRIYEKLEKVSDKYEEVN